MKVTYFIWEKAHIYVLVYLEVHFDKTTFDIQAVPVYLVPDTSDLW